MPTHRRPPISVRHAFALAFDLAVRRDALHSLVVPMLVQAPWFLTLALLPSPETLEPSDPQTLRIVLLTSAALLGQTFTWLLVSGMMRFRARSVFNTAEGVAPAPPLECYSQGLRRVPWLFVTEFVRNLSFSISSLFLFVPFLYLGFKLSMATECVVLEEGGAVRAFGRSFRLTEGRFERWLEQIAASAVLVMTACFMMAVMYLIYPGPGWNTYVAVGGFVIFALLMPIIQYAWTFFFLRLEEVDVPVGDVDESLVAPPIAGPWRGTPGGQPQLRLVEVRPEPEEESQEP